MDDQQLEFLRQLVGMDQFDDYKDAILNHYSKKALIIILNYCNVDYLDSKYDDIIIDFTAYLYKNKDSEGISKKTEGERSIQYEGGIPENIRLALPLPRIKVGCLIMFYDTEIKVLTSPDPASYIKTEYGDVRPFSKSVSFEDGFEIDITKRAFCDSNSFINIDSYVIIVNEIYKVMEIKKWDSYIEGLPV